ncbi:MAG: hypothetical protein KatS3mg110_0774 [Pirellulaceae bacterium]|nr:MAG: hypothetical protein KatS3mg110_0774 [Pirellulaceae bacterium]
MYRMPIGNRLLWVMVLMSVASSATGCHRTGREGRPEPGVSAGAAAAPSHGGPAPDTVPPSERGDYPEEIRLPDDVLPPVLKPPAVPELPPLPELPKPPEPEAKPLGEADPSQPPPVPKELELPPVEPKLPDAFSGDEPNG